MFRTVSETNPELDCKKLKPGNGTLDLGGIFEEEVAEGGVQPHHEEKLGEEFVQSVNFPKNYLNNYQEEKNLVARKGFAIELNFEVFELEFDDSRCRFDYLEILDGGTKLAKLCGSLPRGTKYRSTDNVMKLKFRSDPSGNYRGYRASWKEIPRPRVN